MGLLDDLLGQLAGGPARPNADAPRSGEGGMSNVMVALLPIVLAMLGNRRNPSATSRADMGGGLGDLLEQLQRAGFGDQARSWVGTGRNEPLPPDALEQVFGRGGLAEIARRAGISEREASEGLSQLMPEVVDRVTPDGQVPDATALQASVASLAKRLGV